METKQVFNESLPVGMTVLWYPRADVSKQPTFSEGPLPATVFRCDDGICDLYVIGWGGKPFFKQAVRHISSPNLFDEWGRPNDLAMRDGCWEFTETSKREWDEHYAGRSKEAREKRRLEAEAKKDAEAKADEEKRAAIEKAKQDKAKAARANA